MSSRSKSGRAPSAAAIFGANLVERYAIRWSFMLVNISSQREADLTDIGRFRGRGIHRETREYSLLFLTLAVLLACETRTEQQPMRGGTCSARAPHIQSAPSGKFFRGAAVLPVRALQFGPVELCVGVTEAEIADELPGFRHDKYFAHL